MSYRPMKIVFHLDGAGVSFDPAEPIHLDALLAWALAPFHCPGEPPQRDEEPMDIPLPLGKWHSHGTWGWRASALFPEGAAADAMQYVRKKFRQGRVELTKGSPNLTNGVYREYNMPLPLVLCSQLVAFAVGDPGRVRRALRKHVRFIGKKRAYGKGTVIGIDVEPIDEDFSLSRDGVAMRWLPSPDGPRLVRPRPPYWNMVGRVSCCEVGDIFSGRRDDIREGMEGM